MLQTVAEPEPILWEIWTGAKLLVIRVRSRILWASGAELFMRIRSRIIYEDPEKYYYFISNNKFGILEDPEPNYYLSKIIIIFLKGPEWKLHEDLELNCYYFFNN